MDVRQNHLIRKEPGPKNKQPAKQGVIRTLGLGVVTGAMPQAGSTGSRG